MVLMDGNVGNEEIIDLTIGFVKSKLHDAEGGHDWWHTQRVWKMARRIAKKEDVDLLTVELAALLHDIADAKFHRGDEELGPKIAREFLTDQPLDPQLVDHVCDIIRNMSWKGGIPLSDFRSPEMEVVQDADRLDALGAIGIARAFNYGGFKNRPLFDPDIEPQLSMTREEYKNSTAPTINHFHEKLLLLRDRMNTETGRKIAEQRHHYLEQFLDQFYAEWNAQDG